MTDAIAHRGPDGEAAWTNPQSTIALGHRRLSIIDLSDAAAQPMHYMDRYTILHNGEIYNYIELRNELASKGYSFTTQSDTEVMLAAYDCWQQECVQRFDGMFSFVIWDEKEQQLFGARDRFGEKPFYYCYDKENNRFLFASEMKALWAAGIDKVINNTALLNYLALGYIQNPADLSATFYQNIYSLLPAHYLQVTLSLKEPVLHQYWHLTHNESIKGSPEQHKERFRELFFQSVQRRLRSDVPVGTSLSGGLDSSSIATAIHQYSDLHKGQKCFSAVFPGFEKDEAGYIEKVVKQFNLDSYTVTPTAEGFIKDFEKICRHQEEPFESSSVYAQYKVYELAAQHHVKVIVDGQGADETLAGYSKYIHWYLQELLASGQYSRLRQESKALRKNNIPFQWKLNNYAATALPVQAARQLEKREWAKLEHQQDINRDFFLQYIDRSSIHKPVVKKLNDILYFNTCRAGLPELLRYADRNSMAHGREVRLPFLSHYLVEFIFSLPSSCKIQEGFTKYLLRVSMNGLLPNDITWRTDKTGFEPPQAKWMTDPLWQEFAQESRQKLVNNGILNASVLHKKNQPLTAYAADNFDWRYLVAGSFM